MASLDAELRARFLAVQNERALPIARIAYLAGFVLMLCFLGADALVKPDAVWQTLPVRMISSAAFLTLYFFSRAKDAPARLNLLNLLASLVAGFGISIVLAMLPHGFDYGVAGLNMVIFAAVALTPTWRQALKGGLVVCAVANAVLVLTSQGWFSFGHLNIYLLPSLALAALLSYFLEARHLRTFALEAELERRATTDVLTGVANRRHFTETAEREIDRARRYANKLSLLMLDIDHFKRINDTYGHAVGDEVLKVLPGVVKPLLRKLDFMGRLGGEEFAVVLVETDGEGAAVVAERLRKGLAAIEVRALGVHLHFTVSIGCTEVRVNEQAEDLKRALERADEALYKAKDSGRNRVVVG
ncbi:putative diguanylate cyclase DgcC [Planctomycetaceae bacterium]|nr:putative diguanylate cyclase DgcC [Planctomycetaceae bacterium]